MHIVDSSVEVAPNSVLIFADRSRDADMIHDLKNEENILEELDNKF